MDQEARQEHAPRREQAVDVRAEADTQGDREQRAEPVLEGDPAVVVRGLGRGVKEFKDATQDDGKAGDDADKA